MPNYRLAFEDFWHFVVLKRANDCWPWAGACVTGGYGRLTTADGYILAHRRSYELEHGPIPDGMIVRHGCDNPNCVNPRHLQVGTMKDNTQDMISRGRARWQRRAAQEQPCTAD